jgi:hypothetical protein
VKTGETAGTSESAAIRRGGYRLLAGVLGAALVLALTAELAVASEPPHMVVAFSASKPAQVAQAAAAGITTDILYGGPPPSGGKVAKALAAAHMTVIDARLSGVLYDWECHRTHTVAPPPRGERNTYCRKDWDPAMDSPEAVLAAIRVYLEEDASNPLVSGYWVLDDWVWWDGGSARNLLQSVRAEIEEVTPAYPAICGFGGAVQRAGAPEGFDPATAANFSPAGCSMVGLYNYAEPTRKPSSGEELDWSMHMLLVEEMEDLADNGWAEPQTPMLGIDQAWSGRFAGRYEPGLSATQILTQAEAFCAAGASSIGWYAWADSGFTHKTQTPDDSSEIRGGIEQGIKACGF